MSNSRLSLLLAVYYLLIASHAITTALFVCPLTTTRKSGFDLAGRCQHYKYSSYLSMVEDVDTGADTGETNEFILEKEYERYEQKVTKRGEIEEMLMADNGDQSVRTRLVLPNEPAGLGNNGDIIVAGKKRGGSGGGGFGDSHKAKKNKKDSKKRNKKSEAEMLLLFAQDHAKVLKNEGLVRIDRILSDSITDELRDFVYDIRTTETNKLKATMQAKFPTIRRWDLSIPLFDYGSDGKIQKKTNTIAYHALNDVLQKSAVGETIIHFLGTDDAELYELSSYISDPGSSRQVIHSDTPCFGADNDQAVLCTCFIALQDIRVDMGPTVWLPKTNTYEVHDLFFSEDDDGGDDDKDDHVATPIKDQFLRTHPSVVGLLPKGSCVLFDSRLLHCGTANKSLNDSRALLFFSFKHPNINLFNPGGDTASIRSDLKGSFRLSDFITRRP